MRRGVVAGCVILGLNAAILLCTRPVSRAAASNTDPFRVTVQPFVPGEHKYEYASHREVNPSFDLRCTVTNISGKPQRITAFSCSWDWNWRMDNKHFNMPGWPCFSNFPQTIELAPGEQYERILTVIASPKVWGKKVPLRVGFSSHPKCYATRQWNIPVVWSPPISIKVSRPGTVR